MRITLGTFKAQKKYPNLETRGFNSWSHLVESWEDAIQRATRIDLIIDGLELDYMAEQFTRQFIGALSPTNREILIILSDPFLWDKVTLWDAGHELTPANRDAWFSLIRRTYLWKLKKPTVRERLL